MHLTHRLQFGELGEHEIDRLLDAPVRILLDPVMGHLEVADGDGHEELATTRFLLQGFEGPLSENRQLHLAHRALHAE